MAGESARPTPEFDRHHIVLAPRIDARSRRGYWEVHSRFNRLYRANRMTDAVFEIGTKWRADVYLSTSMPPPSFTTIRTGGGASNGDRPLSGGQMDALTRLRRASAIIKPDGVELLTLVLIEDRSWRGLARRFNCKGRVVQDAMIATLENLEPVYGERSYRA